MRALYHSINSAFEMEQLSTLPDRNTFFDEGLKLIANRSKEFFALSSQYFESDGGGVELLRQSETFTSPKIIGGLMLPIQLPEFSFSAWVSIGAQFARGYLVRKRPGASGSASELACFGWYIDRLNGQSLHFGASDFYPTMPQQERKKQETVTLDFKSEFEPKRFYLITVVVSFDPIAQQQTVTFYRDLTELGRAMLPRPITDCYNNLDGFLVGDTGITMAQLRFYPKTLTLSLIKEIHVIGTVLEDVATGSQPTTSTTSPLDSVSRSFGASLSGLDQRVSEQQPRSEVDLVLQRVDSSERESSATAKRSAPAPFGMLPVEERVDAILGRNYSMLLEGPALLTQPPVGEERYFDPASFPSWRGTGMSLSLWIRKSAGCSGACGAYIISAHPAGMESSVRCWDAWTEKDAVYYDTPWGDFVYTTGIMDERYHQSKNHWRHMTFVWDEDTDEWLFYQDGQLAYKHPWGGSIKEADCASENMRVTIGARFPGWTYGMEDEIHDMRMWVGKALAPAEIYTLASAKTLALSRLEQKQQPDESASEYEERSKTFQHIIRCTPDNSDNMQDTGWVDLFGHSCAWYYNNAAEFPNLCLLPEARLNCPIACKSLQPCLDTSSTATAAKIYYAWDSIRRMEPQADGGVLCLSSKLAASDVYQDCTRWKASATWEQDAEKWMTDIRSSGDGETWRAKRLNFTHCEEVLAAVDEQCVFDAEAVRNFTRDVTASGGDYTIGFWVKPLGENSLSVDGRFYPSVSFISTISPPQINVAFAKFGTGINGEVQFRTACPPSESAAVNGEDVELHPASQDGWTFLAFARTNATTSSSLTSTDLAGFREVQGEWAQCFYDPDMLFNAVEINYPVLMSPILMVPQALPLAKIQEIYYAEVNNMGLRSGPLVTNAQRSRTTLPVTKLDLQPRSVLMATPLLFTTRVKPSADCPFRYSRQMLREQHARVIESKCAFPFVCPADVLSHPESTISCAGETQDRELFFELEPRNVQGDVGFADLLYSITDNEMVFRDGQLRLTRDFIDLHTQKILILLVFFTPQYGITSVMQVSADVSGPRPEVETAISHYTILEGSDLVQYIAVLGCAVLVALVMLFDVVVQWLAVWRRRRASKTSGSSPYDDTGRSQVAKWSTDILNIIMVFVYVALQLPTQIKSAEATERILGTLAGIEWASSTMSLEQKKDVFFESVIDLLDTIEVNNKLDSFLMVILLISLLRIIQCTSLHPRLALLTGTLARAADDLWHTAILIIMIMVSFAGIARWRFGNQYDEFGSFERSMQTEFELMFGQFLPFWGASREMQAFVVLYYMVMFLLILNFLLAIIVESYMQVRRYNEEIEYENEFFDDLSFSIVAWIYGRLRGWPKQEELGRATAALTGKFSLGYTDLCRLGLFRRQQDVEEFLRFYAQLSCLEPPDISNVGHEMEPESRKIVDEVAELLQIKRPKLKDVAKEADELTQFRRSQSQAQSQSQCGSPLAQAQAGPLLPDSASFRSPRGLLASASVLARPVQAGQGSEGAAKHANEGTGNGHSGPAARLELGQAVDPVLEAQRLRTLFNELNQVASKFGLLSPAGVGNGEVGQSETVTPLPTQGRSALLQTAREDGREGVLEVGGSPRVSAVAADLCFENGSSPLGGLPAQLGDVSADL